MRACGFALAPYKPLQSTTELSVIHGDMQSHTGFKGKSLFVRECLPSTCGTSNTMRTVAERVAGGRRKKNVVCFTTCILKHLMVSFIQGTEKHFTRTEELNCKSMKMFRVNLMLCFRERGS